MITTEDLDSLAKAKDANHAKYCEKIRDFYSGRMHWPYNDRINGLSQNYSLETLAHAFISWDDPKQKEEIHAVITSKRARVEDLVEKNNIFRKELNSLHRVKRFNSLETSTERVKFLKDLPFNKIVDLYLYLDNDIGKQKQLCRSLSLKSLKSLTEALDSFEESEAARSCLQAWKGK